MRYNFLPISRGTRHGENLCLETGTVLHFNKVIIASQLQRGCFLPEGVPRPQTRGEEQKEGRPSASRRLRTEDSTRLRAAAEQPVDLLGEAEG
ncbi:hypothetical protein NDU88_006549 [Pleurodeles waltl]|uniref:Uncharacterized protein n=1 Tax=Pleurodeles waltl TaxID=8319 RepID=A0AAV7X2Z8_PLEWA|nr:hypothetical protein NDU88_006549 [Pleurodeles waltl]